MGGNQFSQLPCFAFEKMFHLICCQTTLRCFSDLSLFERATPSLDLTHSVFFFANGVVPGAGPVPPLAPEVWRIC